MIQPMREDTGTLKCRRCGIAVERGPNGARCPRCGSELDRDEVDHAIDEARNTRTNQFLAELAHDGIRVVRPDWPRIG